MVRIPAAGGPTRASAIVIAIIVSVGSLLVPAPVGAQDVTIQTLIVNEVLTQGYWDENGVIDPTEMAAVIDRWGNDIGFAITDREFVVEEDQTQNPAALLAQSTLEQLVEQGGPRTLFLITAGHVGGASFNFPFVNVMTSLDDFDRSNPAGSFALAADTVAALGSEFPTIANAAADTASNAALPTTVAQSGTFTVGRLFIVLALITSALALAATRSARKKKARKVHTSDARDDTKAQIQAMSDLILDLDPRITIEDDPALKKRYVDASDTYREVLEKADSAVTGHEIADLRIEIAKARWKLDVIDAELEGNTPPPEPHTRNTDGSAWDSTRGEGG